MTTIPGNINPARNNFLLCLLLWFPVVSFSQQASQPFLTNLSAGRGFPIYTTYAADKQRSAFTLDEGYGFLCDVDLLGADLTTDTGGDMDTSLIW
jgi:hypothetical protein